MTHAADDSVITDDDRRFMAAALAIGRRGLGRTAPNPSVGAVLVKDGRIVGRGCTGDGGRPHGERVAIAQAGEAARGATLYVTLEPCSHHGQTPPCCEAIVAAGIARLVYAIEDPNPLVAGNGAAFCRAHGLAVVAGMGAEQAQRDHAGHSRRMIQRRPMITLKLAETADGFVAGGTHDPRLSISGVAANGMVHVLRAMHDAIMVGIGTARADDPLMTVRLPGVTARPTRIVLDARLAISPRSRLLSTVDLAPAVILAADEAIRARGAALQAPGVELLAVPLDHTGRIDLAAALASLADRGLTRIFSEGGPTVAAALIGAGFADDVLIFTAPRPFGGDGVPTLPSAARSTLDTTYRLAEDRMVGPDRLRRWEAAH